MYLFAPVAFVMKVTALHLWSIFTPKSGANAKEREKRMHFGVAQRFAALIAGVRQTSVKLRAEAAAGLPRSVRGHAGLWRGMFSERGGGFVLCTERRAYGRVKEIRLRGAGVHRGTCVLRPSAARTVGSKRFSFGKPAHIEVLAFCVQAARVSNIRAVESDCMTGGRDYKFRVFDPTAPFYQKITKNLLKICSQSEQYVIK